MKPFNIRGEIMRPMNPLDVLSDGTDDVPKREKTIVVLGRENAGIALQLAVLMASRENLRNETDRLEVRITLEADMQKINLRRPDDDAQEDLFQVRNPSGTMVCVMGDRSMLSKSIADSMSSLEGKVVYAPDMRKENLNAQVNPFVPPGRSAATLRHSARKRR